MVVDRPVTLDLAQARELVTLVNPQVAIAASRIPGEAVDLPRRNGDHGAYYRRMHDALRGTGPLPVTPEDALPVMHLLELAERSAREGRQQPAALSSRAESDPP